MPLYYFNIYNDAITLDHEGSDLADLHAAKAFAVEGARSLAAETASNGYIVRAHRIEIVDKDRKLLGTVRFDEAVEIR